MEAEKVFKRLFKKKLTEKQKTFFQSFLIVEEIKFETILNSQFCKEIIQDLKNRWNKIEEMKKDEKLYFPLENKRVSKVIIQGKTEREAKQILKHQKSIGKIIPILEEKILPEVKKHEKLIKINNEPHKINIARDKNLHKNITQKRRIEEIINSDNVSYISNNNFNLENVPKELEQDIVEIRQKIIKLISIKKKPQINHICRVIADQYETIKVENRYTDKPKSSKIKPKVVFKPKDLFSLSCEIIPELKELYNLKQLMNSFSKGCL